MVKAEKGCGILAHDIQRLSSVVAEFASGAGPPGSGRVGTLRGSIFGPEGKEIAYAFTCRRPQEMNEWGPGTCGSYEIERSGPGAAGLPKTAGVGNIHGLARQVSRDIGRLWGCVAAPERGFDGARAKRSRKRPKPRRKKR